jgi:agmatinase
MVYPRFEGISTFMRLPHTQDLTAVDAAVVGVPFDTGVTYRSGARVGPQAVRAGSRLLRPYNHAQKVDIFEHLSVVDYGDVPVVPGFIQESYAEIERGLAPIHAAGVVPIAVGGDHSIALPELRAAAAAHGVLGLAHFDSHSDTWDAYWGQKYTHGTPFRRAIEEGLIEPGRAIQVGMRGSGYGPGDVQDSRDLGLELIDGAEMFALGVDAVTERVRERVGSRPAFLSFDIDFIDPAYAPGTGTPEVGGPTAREALAMVRGLIGINFVAFDLVEVLPQFDVSELTAMTGANVIFEFLSLLALYRRKHRKEWRRLSQPIGTPEYIPRPMAIADSWADD